MITKKFETIDDLRSSRNELLKLTDGLMGPDVPDHGEIEHYREYLRELPANVEAWLELGDIKSIKEVEIQIPHFLNVKEQTLGDELSHMIYLNYPQEKQNSDLADKIYYETTLKAGDYAELEKDIIGRAEKILGGNTLDEVLADVADKDKDGVAQLVKAAVRVTWVVKCKEVYKKAVAEDIEPQYPAFPKI